VPLLHEVYIFEKLDWVWLSHFGKEDEVKSLILTNLKDKVRVGDLYQGRVQRIEGERAWVDIGCSKPALLRNKASSLKAGEVICVHIDRIPLRTIRGYKGAQVTQNPFPLEAPSNKIGKIYAAPEEWLSYLLLVKEPLTVVMNTERLFLALKEANVPHHLTLKSDISIPAEVRTVWQSLIDPVIDLPKGGWIFIQEGETLTAIDVNTGGGEFIRADLKNNYHWVEFNKSVVPILQAEIKLRQIGGMIVIDFPCLKDKKDQKIIYEMMKRYDDGTSQLFGFTQGGLFEMTRPKKNDSLSRRSEEIKGNANGFIF
jgi:Ribonuclease G/E